MWEPYFLAKLPAPTEEDRTRLEVVASGPLQPGYWELATAHGGEALDQDLVQNPAFEAFILLLVVAPERLGKAEAGYSVASTLRDVMPCYPAGLLPFANDTGGNLWAFDYRTDPAACSVVFTDHEGGGEAGVSTVAPDFASFLVRIGLAPG